MRGLLPPRPRFSWRNGAGYEWTAGLTPHCMVAAGLTQLLHTQAWQRHSVQCCFILRTHWRTQTPGLGSHTKLPPAIMEKSHMKNIRGQSTIWTQGGQWEDGVSTQLTRWVTGMWYICHHAPKTKAERFVTLSQQKFMDNKGAQHLHSTQWKGLGSTAQLLSLLMYLSNCRASTGSECGGLPRRHSTEACLSTISEIQLAGLVCPQQAGALGNTLTLLFLHL